MTLLNCHLEVNDAFLTYMICISIAAALAQRWQRQEAANIPARKVGSCVPHTPSFCQFADL